MMPGLRAQGTPDLSKTGAIRHMPGLKRPGYNPVMGFKDYWECFASLRIFFYSDTISRAGPRDT